MFYDCCHWQLCDRLVSFLVAGMIGMVTVIENQCCTPTATDVCVALYVVFVVFLELYCKLISAVLNC